MKKGRRWEYLTVWLIPAPGEPTVLERLNRLGNDGWELAAIVNELGYFKREVPA